MTPHLTLSKKILSVLLSVLLVVAFVPAVAFAGNDDPFMTQMIVLVELTTLISVGLTTLVILKVLAAERK